MSHDSAAVVFDLDDTLYPYRRFVRSGFAAVAAYLQREYAVPAQESFRVMVQAARGPRRGRELQAAIQVFALPPGTFVEVIRVMQDHDPHLRLPGQSHDTLRALKRGGWQLGVLTNGVPSVQARKIAALGLCPYVDAVVYATECGTGAGKPDRQPFHDISRRLNVAPDRVVVVGNDERCDVIGAIDAGMRSIRCAAWTPIAKPTVADAVVRQLRHVPRVAEMLIEQGPSRHAA